MFGRESAEEPSIFGTKSFVFKKEDIAFIIGREYIRVDDEDTAS